MCVFIDFSLEEDAQTLVAESGVNIGAHCSCTNSWDSLQAPLKFKTFHQVACNIIAPIFRICGSGSTELTDRRTGGLESLPPLTKTTVFCDFATAMLPTLRRYSIVMGTNTRLSQINCYCCPQSAEHTSDLFHGQHCLCFFLDLFFYNDVLLP